MRLSAGVVCIAWLGLAITAGAAGDSSAEPASSWADGASSSGCAPALEAPADPPGQVHDLLNEGTPLRPGAALPATGTLRTVMLFVDFSDHPGTGDTRATYDLLVPSAVDFFDRASYGRLTLEVEHVRGWLRMPRPFTSYAVSGSRVSYDDQRDFVADAVAAADASVDFSRFQAVYVVAAKDSLPGAFVLPLLHPGKGVVADGAELRAWMGIGSVAWYEPQPGMAAKNSTWHDTAHWLGLPDLYGRTAADETTWEYAGSWDLMSDNVIGAHLLAWHSYRLGWIDADQLRCLEGPGTLETELTPASAAEGTKALVVETGPSTAMVAEVRQSDDLDAGLCDGGVLVYSVDARVSNGNGPVRVQRAQPDDPERAGYFECGPGYNAAFDLGEGEVATFTDPATGTTIEVVRRTVEGYVVRASVPGGPDPEPSPRRVDLTLARHLRAAGSVTSPDGPAPCTSRVPVTVQRKIATGWRDVGTATTAASGTFRVRLPDRAGMYRAVAARATVAEAACAGAASRTVRHRHPS